MSSCEAAPVEDPAQVSGKAFSPADGIPAAQVHPGASILLRHSETVQTRN